MIEIKNVSLVLGQGRKILDDISLRISENERWVLIGRNGSGKSKLLEIICGYKRQSSGEVIRFGDPSPDLRQVRKRISYTASYLKSHVSPGETVIRIVEGGFFGSIGLYDEITDGLRERAVSLLALAGLAGFEKREFSTLSDGEKQRVLVARAFMINPEIVIFDEPSAGLDILSREELLETVKSVIETSNASLVYVTHHVEEITGMFTHAAVLKNGSFTYCGPLTSEKFAEGIESLFEGRVMLDRHGERWYSRVI